MGFNNIWYRLLGYSVIDEVRGLWKHSVTDLSGNERVIADYSLYKVWYNTKRDRYKLEVGGFKPLSHPLNSELRIIIENCNTKPKNDFFEFTHTSRDYFFQKDELFEFINSTFSEVEQVDGRIMIVRFDLDNNRDSVLKMMSSSSDLVTSMEYFKKTGLKKGVEIYEDHGNIIITSEGYYVAVFSDSIKVKEDEFESDEDEEE